MIPLARWLKKDGEQSGCAPVTMHVLDEHASEMHSCMSNDGLGEGIRERDQDISMLEEQVADLMRQLEQAKSDSESREADLELQFSKHLIAQLGADLHLGLCRLQEDLEAAVIDSLAPFLERQVTARSAAELRRLVKDALSESSETLVEFRAPPQLHPFLKEMCEEAGFSGSMKDGPLIELQFSSGRSRFQTLADRWVELLSGDGT